MDSRLFPFQREDISKIVGAWRNRSVYIGWEMGLGKTAASILSWEACQYKRILIVTPAAARMVWPGEISQWGQHEYKIQTISTRADVVNPYADIVVISYDLAVVPAIAQQLLALTWDLAVYDEAHGLGNPKSKRTRLCCGTLFPKVGRTFFLSGSISRDKIINVWPAFRTLCPAHIPPYWSFVRRFVHTEQGDYGLRFLGGKNLKQLGDIAASNFLLRRKKKDVLAQLPDKLEQKILFELPGAEAARQKQAAIDFADEAESALEAGGKVSDIHLSQLRRELGIQKLAVIREQVLGTLGIGEEPDGVDIAEHEKKVVVFVYHRAVYQALQGTLERAGLHVVGFEGATGKADRERAVAEFRGDKAQVFLGTFAAAESIDLTAASTVIFGEMSWVLSQNEQAEDRLHRITQKSTVYVKRIIAKDSIDEIVYKAYKRKLNDKRRAFG